VFEKRSAVSLLDADRDLAAGLADRTVDEARVRLVARSPLAGAAAGSSMANRRPELESLYDRRAAQASAPA
jgi:hypothetical protein